MLFLALGLVLGGRMLPVINGQPNLKFVQVWSSVAFFDARASHSGNARLDIQPILRSPPPYTPDPGRFDNRRSGITNQDSRAAIET